MKEESKLKFLVEDTLGDLGVPPHLKGYRFLREGIILVVKDEMYLDAVTKELYPMIGVIFSVSGSAVERGIRHAIGAASCSPEKDLWSRLFYREDEIPSNSRFIGAVARSVQRKMYEIEEEEH